jgi:hypothetical protein
MPDVSGRRLADELASSGIFTAQAPVSTIASVRLTPTNHGSTLLYFQVPATNITIG